MNIYTKSGDKGTTDLVRTKNVSKSDDRIQLVGTIDELTSHLGLVKTMMEDYGNPSSKHIKGMEAEKYLRESRELIAKRCV